MKKTLLALGTAAACLGSAHAQSQVQLAGLVDMYVGSMKAPGGQRAGTVGSGGLTTSWWGIQGSEDLGGGLKVGFEVSAFFKADTGAPGRWQVGSASYEETFFARDAYVSLSGDFGSVKLGRSLAPNFLPAVIANPFAESFVISPLVIHGNMSWGSTDTNFAYTTTASDTGWSNQILYSTPSIHGLSANLHYQFGEQGGGNRSKKNVGANLMYFQGPVALTAFVERAQISNPNTAVLGYTKQNWMLGGSYDLQLVKLYASYGQSQHKDTRSNKIKTTSLGMDVPVSAAGTFKAAAAQTKADTSHTQRKTYTLGYNHVLSKRTDVYSAVMYDKIERAAAVTDNGSGTSVLMGIRHRF